MDTPILLTTCLFPPRVGGSPILYEQIYSRLAARGVPVEVLSDPFISPGPEGPYQGMLVHRERRLDCGRWGLLHPKAAMNQRRIARHLARTVPEGGVVHTGRGLPEGLWAWMAHRMYKGPRYVCWVHGEDVTALWSSRELRHLMKRVYGSAAACLCNSENSMRALDELGVRTDHVTVAYPGVDLGRFQPAMHDGAALRRRFGFTPDDVVMLTVGRLQRRKGHDMLIRAVAELKTARPHLRAFIVGDGEERNALEHLAEELGVTDRIRFAGEVGGADLPACYDAADLFAMPNRDEGGDIEGFGIVFIEAQAMGVPVIGGNSGGAPEAVAHEEVGLLVEGADVASVTEAVGRLAGDADLRARFGAAGRERAKRFTWDAAAEQVLSVHQQMAAQEEG